MKKVDWEDWDMEEDDPNELDFEKSIFYNFLSDNNVLYKYVSRMKEFNKFLINNISIDNYLGSIEPKRYLMVSFYLDLEWRMINIKWLEFLNENNNII